MHYTSISPEETYKIAAKIAEQFMDNGTVARGGVVALIGDLGAGKTTFTQGFARALGIPDKIISPTFTVIRQHKIPNTKFVLYHIDLYRLDDFKDLGLEELFSDPNALVLIEWAEKITNHLPKKIVMINLKNTNTVTREIEIDL